MGLGLLCNIQGLPVWSSKTSKRCVPWCGLHRLLNDVFPVIRLVFYGIFEQVAEHDCATAHACTTYSFRLNGRDSAETSMDLLTSRQYKGR